MKYIFYLVVLLIALSACEDKKIDDVNTGIYDHTPYIQKDWTLVNVLQIDEKAGPGKLKSLDITDAVIGGNSATLLFEGENYTATGVLAQTLGESGTWAFDDEFFPTEVLFNAGGESQVIPLGQSLTSFSTELKLKAQDDFCVDGSVVTSYQYIFEQN